MKRLLVLFPLLVAGPATASIYVNLETREVTETADGIDLVRITDGKNAVRTTNPKAKWPDGALFEYERKKTVPISDADFQYYSDLHQKLIVEQSKDIDYTDPKYGVKETYDCATNRHSRTLEKWDSETCRRQISVKECNSIREQNLNIKDYPVDGERRVSQWLRYLEGSYCERSNLIIGCRSGSCYGAPWSGEYGFYPGKWNVISIDGRKWNFRDGLTRQQQIEIWSAIKDGSRFAYQLIHFPYESQVTGSQTISLPAGLKDKIYRMSLIKP